MYKTFIDVWLWVFFFLLCFTPIVFAFFALIFRTLTRFIR